MTIVKLVELFQQHCQIVKEKLSKHQMLLSLEEGICPFRCRYCKMKHEGCSNCQMLDMKESDEFKECQLMIKRNPDYLKILLPVLKGINWEHKILEKEVANG